MCIRIFPLLSEDDLAAGADVLTCLGGTFVGASLETDDVLSGLELFFSEISLVFVRWLGSQVRSFPFGMSVGLPAKSEDSGRYVEEICIFNPSGTEPSGGFSRASLLDKWVLCIVFQGSGPCNSEYFQQHEGTAMVNLREIKDKFEYLPRVWFKYVDDIFAVCDTKAISLDNFVAKLNNRFPTIKFTYEMEHNEQLPFLDVLVIRNSENKLEFDVYRKETATLRYIPNDSHHPFQHKMASFNFIIHRLLNFPLRFEHEKRLIKNIAKSNAKNYRGSW
ncbi:hypothetical protein NQ318_015534 [Aromia moschata]|uniref:Reverse transcriptase domain-containing protein n=1 Tax=Aromia moschata TaxID=1265417 RepID=A0AAV8Y7P3_9CUCU|nr:hypothetical protein NQ318_015534 [Aromia moschata]